jgi:hypothetical protein
MLKSLFRAFKLSVQTKEKLNEEPIPEKCAAVKNSYVWLLRAFWANSQTLAGKVHNASSGG